MQGRDRAQLLPVRRNDTQAASLRAARMRAHVHNHAPTVQPHLSCLFLSQQRANRAGKRLEQRLLDSVFAYHR
eukprot:395657-Pleurochrysis_carterae.AAC.11